MFRRLKRMFEDKSSQFTLAGKVFDMSDIQRGPRGTWTAQSLDGSMDVFFKLCTQEEIDITKALRAFELPEGSNMILPTYLGGRDDLPNKVADFFGHTVPNRDELMISLAHPLKPHGTPGGHTAYAGVQQYVDDQKIPLALRGEPLTQEDLDTLEESVLALNKAGIFNNDFGSNLFFAREEDGKVRFYAIDFEPNTVTPYTETEHEDVTQIQQMGANLFDYGYVNDPENPQAPAVKREKNPIFNMGTINTPEDP